MTGSLSLERGLAVLQALKEAEEPLGVREIARRLELSAAAVQRLLNTLAERGYVEQTGDLRRYRVGLAVLALAQQVLRQERLVPLAEAELRAAAADSCFNGFLGVRRNTAAVYLLAVQSDSPVVIRASAGEDMPLHATALGKALLTGLDDEAIIALLGEGPLEAVTARTVTEPAKLLAQLRTARSLGYATVLDENLPGIASVGAPLRDAEGTVVAAVSLAFPRAICPGVKIAAVGQQVAAMAARISAGLGYRPEKSNGERSAPDAA